MTSQYEQGDINLRDASPVAVTTLAAAPLDFIVDSLTGNGQKIFVSVIGAGSDRADPATNNYTLVTLSFQASRNAGVITIEAVLNVNIAEGLGATVVPIAVGDDVVLRITGNAAVANYDHRLKVSKIRY
jgi:hypothetical protein